MTNKILSTLTQVPNNNDRMIGTYLYPWRYFDSPSNLFTQASEEAATEVVIRLAIENDEVLITRMGGLFISPPAHFSDLQKDSDFHDDLNRYQEKLVYEEHIANLFNLIICELALVGLVSEPATPIDIHYAQHNNGHCIVPSSSGGREHYTHRSTQPLLAVTKGLWPDFSPVDPSILAPLVKLEKSTLLSKLSASLPSVTSSAYYNYSRRMNAEALINAWLVTEQIINFYWKQLLEKYDDTRRKKLSRYNMSQKSKRLLTEEIIDQDIYEKIEAARKSRNDLAHEVKITTDTCNDGIIAMHCMIEKYLGCTVDQPQASSIVDW